MLFCEFCEIFKNIFFTEHLGTTVSELKKVTRFQICFRIFVSLSCKLLYIYALGKVPSSDKVAIKVYLNICPTELNFFAIANHNFTVFWCLHFFKSHLLGKFFLEQCQQQKYRQVVFFPRTYQFQKNCCCH